MTFTTRIMKYQHFHPPGMPLCSTYNEILTFSLFRSAPGSGFFVFVRGIVELAWGPSRWVWAETAHNDTPWEPHFFEPLGGGRFLLHLFTMVLTMGHIYIYIYIFATEHKWIIMDYHGLSLIIYVFWNINIFTLRRSLLLHVYWNINIFILPERLFAQRIVKY